MSPNQRALEKRKLNIWIDVELYVALRRISAISGQSMSTLVSGYIAELTRSVKLTQEDRDEIARWYKNNG